MILTVSLFGCAPVTPQYAEQDTAPEWLLCDNDVAERRALLREETLSEGLVGMWMGASVGAWTGLQTEGLTIAPPFLTDADRDAVPLVTLQPWQSTHEIDLEYLYLSLLWESDEPTLSPMAIQTGWLAHLSGEPSPSTATALDLLAAGLSPTATGLGAVNSQAWLGDAQRAVEALGALAPGRPDLALALADAPIQTTADGYAVHAAEFLVVLYSLALVAPEGTVESQLRWLIEQARGVVPDTSKTADVIDTALDLAGTSTWEESRDALYRRYQRNPEDAGFTYRGWQGSSINLAATLTALLHCQGDPARAIEIAALAGWESDTSAATVGGLLGLLVGAETLEESLGEPISEHYQSDRTLLDMPDYLPEDDAASDTFSLIARRSLSLTGALLEEAGAIRTDDGWLVETWQEGNDLLTMSPAGRRHRGSARYRIEESGGLITAVSSVSSNPPTGTGNPAVLINGSESDSSGTEPLLLGTDGDCLLPASSRACFSTEGADDDEVSLTIRYDRPVTIDEVVFWEGHHRGDGERGGSGGWFIDSEVEIFVGEDWESVAVAPSPEPSEEPFQVLIWRLPERTEITGIRLKGSAEHFVTALELDGRID